MSASSPEARADAFVGGIVAAAFSRKQAVELARLEAERLALRAGPWASVPPEAHPTNCRCATEVVR